MKNIHLIKDSSFRFSPFGMTMSMKIARMSVAAQPQLTSSNPSSMIRLSERSEESRLLLKQLQVNNFLS